MIKLRDTVISNVPPDKYHVWVKPNNGKYEMYIFSTSKGVWVRISGSGGGSGTGGDTAELEAQIQRIQRELDEANAKYELLEGKIVADAVTVTYQQAQSGITVGGDGKYYSKIVIEPNPSSITKPKFTSRSFSPGDSTWLKNTTHEVTATCKIDVGSSSWSNVKVILEYGSKQYVFSYETNKEYSYTATVSSAETWQWKLSYEYKGVHQGTINDTSKANYKFGLPIYYGHVLDNSKPESFTSEWVTSNLTATGIQTTYELTAKDYGETTSNENKWTAVWAVPQSFNVSASKFDLNNGIYWTSTDKIKVPIVAQKTQSGVIINGEANPYDIWIGTESFILPGQYRINK